MANGKKGMDWDKLKVFHAAAEAGSFTHAGEQLGLSQSAVSRQVSALEQELSVSLFHRHARGLILTEQGELLYRTAHDVFMKLEAARAKLTDSREKPHGELKVTTTPGIGIHWLTPRLGEFMDLFPDIRITLITTDEELDLAMREADVAIRLRQPTQPDLIQRKLFSVHFHAYASAEYLKRAGTPRTLEELDNHRIIQLGGSTVPVYLQNRNWLTEVSRNGKGPRQPSLHDQQHHGRVARLPARPGHRAVAGLSGRGERRPRAAVRRRRRSGARCVSSSIRKSSSRWRACRRSAISWSATHSAGASDAPKFRDTRSKSTACRITLRCAWLHPCRILPAPHGWHAALCIVRRPHRAALFGCAVGAGLSHPPRLASPVSAVSSPLEGDCRPSRADMTEPGPQGSGFYFGMSARRETQSAADHAQSRSLPSRPL